MVHDSPNKLYIGGLPLVFTEDQVKELLQQFGELRAFHLVTESDGSSKVCGVSFDPPFVLLGLTQTGPRAFVSVSLWMRQ